MKKYWVSFAHTKKKTTSMGNISVLTDKKPSSTDLEDWKEEIKKVTDADDLVINNFIEIPMEKNEKRQLTVEIIICVVISLVLGTSLVYLLLEFIKLLGSMGRVY